MPHQNENYTSLIKMFVMDDEIYFIVLYMHQFDLRHFLFDSNGF